MAVLGSLRQVHTCLWGAIPLPLIIQGVPGRGAWALGKLPGSLETPSAQVVSLSLDSDRSGRSLDRSHVPLANKAMITLDFVIPL